MANTYVDYTATADQISNGFEIPFEYLEDEHVIVEVNGVLNTNTELTTGTPIKIKVLSGVSAGQNVRVRRKSQPDTDLVDFVNGSVLTESELDRSYRHNRYLHAEISELNDASLQVVEGSTAWDAQNEQIKNVGTPVDSGDATTKNYVDSAISGITTGTGSPPSFSKFTGNGSDTEFALTFTANVTSSSAMLVTIAGEVIDPDDYTIVGASNLIRFDTPPTNLAEILVIERGFKTAITDIPTDYDYGSIVGDPVTASFSYGGIA